jgi:hypothetical protein
MRPYGTISAGEVVSQTPNPNEDYEVVVAPASPPPRKARAQNPAVDDVIQTGEIAPRSRVVRSSSRPIVTDERDDDTEPVQSRTFAPPIVVTRSKKIPPIVWLVAAIAPVLAAIALRAAHPAPVKPAQITSSPEADALAQLAGTLFDGEARAAKARADAIATSSMLRAAIQTDAKTLQNMASDKDLVFPLNAGESMEVFQGTGANHVAMLTLPARAAQLVMPPAGTAQLRVHGTTVEVVVGAAISTTTGSSGGELALAAPIDLHTLQARGGKLTAIALTGGGTPIDLGGGAPAAGGKVINAPISTAFAKGPSLAIAATVAAAASADSGNDALDKAGYACAALATLFLIMFAVSLFRK